MMIKTNWLLLGVLLFTSNLLISQNKDIIASSENNGDCFVFCGLKNDGRQKVTDFYEIKSPKFEKYFDTLNIDTPVNSFKVIEYYEIELSNLEIKKENQLCETDTIYTIFCIQKRTDTIKLEIIKKSSSYIIVSSSRLIESASIDLKMKTKNIKLKKITPSLVSNGFIKARVIKKRLIEMNYHVPLDDFLDEKTKAILAKIALDNGLAPKWSTELIDILGLNNTGCTCD